MTFGTRHCERSVAVSGKGRSIY